MADRFIKFIPSPTTDWLRENHPNAFLLLSLIAERARRFVGHIDGLEIGEAYIGDYKKAGIETRGKYRQAVKILCSLNFIKITVNCRKCKNAATSTTTAGTIVKLLNSDIWDINSEDNNHLNNHQTTTSQPLTRKNKKEKEEEKEKNIKKRNLDLSGFPENQTPLEILSDENFEHNITYNGGPQVLDNKDVKETPPPLKPKPKAKNYDKTNFQPDQIINFPPNVWLPKTEFEELKTKLGEEYVKYHIQKINDYVDEKNKPYKKYSATIRNFHERAIKWKNLPTRAELSLIFNKTESQSIEQPRFKARNPFEGMI